MAIKPISRGFSGVNNAIPAERIKYDPDTGISSLSEAVNVVIDDSYQVARRLGKHSLSSVDSHSLFCDKGDAFVVQNRTNDSAIYRIGTDFSLTGIVSGLVKGARVSWCQVGPKSFYMNGYECGVIEEGIFSQWPANNRVGVRSLKSFGPVPIGHKIAHFRNRMWVAVEDGDHHVIYVSESNSFGVFRYAGRGFPFPTKIRMIKPVLGGVWVSDSQKTGFIEGSDKFDQMKWSKRSSCPAHEWSENIELVDLSKTVLEIPGLSAVWSSDEGLTVGTEDGRLIVTTKDKLVYPTGGSGATVVYGNNVINTVC